MSILRWARVLSELPFPLITVRASSLTPSPSAHEPDTVIEALSAGVDEDEAPPTVRDAGRLLGQDGEVRATRCRDGQLGGLLRAGESLEHRAALN